MCRPTGAGRPNAVRRCASPIRASGRALRRCSAASRKPQPRSAPCMPTRCTSCHTKSKTRSDTMRFMVIVKASKESEAGKMPSEDMLAKMAKFNEEMVKAGIMLDAAGLQASSKGARIRFTGDKRSVIDGPFAETKELIAGYWIIQVKNKAEAIEWMKRCPKPHDGDCEIEIRHFFELEDFGESAATDHHKAVGEQMAAQRK